MVKDYDGSAMDEDAEFAERIAARLRTPEHAHPSFEKQVMQKVWAEGLTVRMTDAPLPFSQAVAQDTTGSVSGSVHANSATGAAVPNVTVEVLTAGSLITDADPTHVVRSTSTDTNGNYRIAFLLPGTYVVCATPPAASGFKPALLPGGLTITTATETQSQTVVVAP